MIGYRQKISLNEISHRSAIGLVKKAIQDYGIDIEEVICDTVGPEEKVMP